VDSGAPGNLGPSPTVVYERSQPDSNRRPLGAITEKGEAPRWLRPAQATLRKFRSLKFSQFGSTDGITAGVFAWVAAVSIQPRDAEFRVMPDRTVSPQSASPEASRSVQAIDRNVPEPWLLLLF
jgi:hypothetical protein